MNKGKSGSARLITYVVYSNSIIFLVGIYTKAEKVSISEKEIRMLIKELEGQFYVHGLYPNIKADYPIVGFLMDEENGQMYSVTVDCEPNLVQFNYLVFSSLSNTSFKKKQLIKSEIKSCTSRHQQL